MIEKDEKSDDWKNEKSDDWKGWKRILSKEDREQWIRDGQEWAELGLKLEKKKTD